MKKSGIEFERELYFLRCVAASHDTVFVAGGYGLYDDTYYDTLYSVSVSANGATIEHKYKMPTPLQSFGCVYLDGCIFFFGGQTTDDEYSDMIFVFDIAQCEWRRSILRCPKKSRYHVHAVLMGV